MKKMSRMERRAWHLLEVEAGLDERLLRTIEILKQLYFRNLCEKHLFFYFALSLLNNRDRIEWSEPPPTLLTKEEAFRSLKDPGPPVVMPCWVKDIHTREAEVKEEIRVFFVWGPLTHDTN